MDFPERFRENWKSKGFSPHGRTVLIAVSGGVDSMVMAQLFRETEIPFAIGNCNFKLRGADADLDSELVAEWAQKHGITCHQVSFDTLRKADEWGKGIQETARILRYEWLLGLLREHKYYRIATAHHADDNAETLLMNLFKGTGIAGLHGIPEQTETVIRPLLFARKQDIVDYATANGVPYRDDVSNASDDYLRNSVRHHVIPAIQQVFPNAVDNIKNTIQRVAEAETFYRQAINKERKQLLEQRGKDWYIPVLKLAKRQPLNTICYELFSPFGFAPSQLPFIIQLLVSETGHFIESDTHRLIKNRDFLVVTARQTQESDLILIESVPSRVETGDAVFRFTVQERPASIPTDPNLAYLDLRNINFPLQLRRWKTGDYFYPLGMGMKKKKLSKFFIDQKIPLHEKERARVIESGKRIVWVTGMRMDERFKVTAHTEKVLVIERKQV